jgi:hypothetical protein
VAFAECVVPLVQLGGLPVCLYVRPAPRVVHAMVRVACVCLSVWSVSLLVLAARAVHALSTYVLPVSQLVACPVSQIQCWRLATASLAWGELWCLQLWHFSLNACDDTPTTFLLRISRMCTCQSVCYVVLFPSSAAGGNANGSTQLPRPAVHCCVTAMTGAATYRHYPAPAPPPKKQVSHLTVDPVGPAHTSEKCTSCPHVWWCVHNRKLHAITARNNSSWHSPT